MNTQKFYNLNLFGKFLLSAFICLALFSAAFAQETGTDTAEQIAQVTEFDVNGMKVLVKRRPNSPTVAAGLFIRGGSRSLTDKDAGIEDFLLEAMTEGSRKYPREVLRRELAQTASSIGSGTNYDFSALSLASTRENFDRSWDVFTDIILNPALTPQDVELARTRILTGLQNREDSPDSFLSALEDKVIYANTAYANSPDGTLQTIAALKASDLRAYHQKLLQTSRLLLVVVGDLEPADLQKRVTATFSKVPRGTYKDLPVPTLDFSKSTLDVTPRELETNYVQGVFAAPTIGTEDFYAMRVAVSILNQNVLEEVRFKRNLSYAPSAEMSNTAANTANIYVTSVDANQSVTIMLNEIEKLKNAPVNAREISGTVGQFLTNYYLGQETNAAQAAELARYELVGGGWRKAFDFLDKVKEVTPEQVQSVSQKYMKNLRFIVLGNPNAINRQIFLGQ